MYVYNHVVGVQGTIPDLFGFYGTHKDFFTPRTILIHLKSRNRLTEREIHIIPNIFKRFNSKQN